MNRRAFYQLLQRYLDGHCTDEEKKLVEQWYELLDDDHDPVITPEEIKDTVQRLWPGIKESTYANHLRQLPARKLRWPKGYGGQRKKTTYWRWASAAAVLILIGSGGYWLWKGGITGSAGKGQVATMKDLRSFTNERTVSDTVLLPDKSLVILEPQATIRYPDSFGTLKREVYLEGNAFFTVTRNAAAPFYVYSNHIVTRVLGTSFFVKTNRETNDIEVSVCTGKVAVYSDESSGVILKPNQKVIYNREDRHFRTTLVDMPLPLVPDTGKGEKVTALNFVFEEEPITKVLAHLESAYHIAIILEQENLGKALFSGDIKGQNLYDQLEIICQSIQATYEIKGTTILIKGGPDD
jgi:transmembrane sensor